MMDTANVWWFQSIDGNFCAKAYDSLVIVGHISEKCECAQPWKYVTGAEWTDVEFNGQKIKIRSLGGSKFEFASPYEKAPVYRDSDIITGNFCKPVPGAS